MSGPCTSSAWKACRRANTGGTPSATSRRASCSCSSRQVSGPIWSITSLSSANESRAWSTASLIRCPSARTRYQREVVSTSQSTPFSSSPCSSGSIWPSSASMSAHRSIEPVTSRAILNALHHLGRAGARLGHHPRDERDPLCVDDVVRGDRRHELPLQRMVLDQVAVPLHHRRREVGLQILQQVGRVGELRVQQGAPIERFAYASSTASSGRTSPSPAPRRSPSVGRGQELDLALQLVLGLELLHQILVALVPLDAELHLLGQDLGLEVVVVEHVGHDVLRARLQQHVALVDRELASLYGEVQQDLDVHLVVGGVDARRLSMKSVLMRPPCFAYSTRPRWVKPRFPPSPTMRARTWLPLTRTGSFARSPTSVWPSPSALT